MKKLLRKRIGGKRQREWAWAAVIIALCTAVVALWGGSQGQGDEYGQMQSNVNAGNAPGLVHGAGASGAMQSTTVDTSVAGVIASLPNASDFNSYLVSTGLASQLRGGSYTIFVPTNTAFAASRNSLAGLSFAAQKRLVEYHIVAGKLLNSSAIMSGTQQAMSRDTLNFSVNLQTGSSYVDSGMVIRQYRAQNGIIYLIDSVLFPPR